MTSQTGQFLKQLLANAQRKSTSLTPPAALPMQSGESSNDALSNEPTLDNDMIFPKKNSTKDWAEIAGAAVGLIAAGVISLLLGGWVIHWILTGIGIGSLTYGQVVGLLAIWEIVKPRGDSK
jgi:hypothetical protein